MIFLWKSWDWTERVTAISMLLVPPFVIMGVNALQLPIPLYFVALLNWVLGITSVVILNSIGIFFHELYLTKKKEEKSEQ